MPNYSKGKVYKIICNITGLVYYGSTTRTLAQRLTEHRSRFKNNVLGCKSLEIIKNGDYNIILCEDCPCENKEQLKAVERKWIENNNCVNKLIPSRTSSEYYQEKKVEINIKKKNRYEENKDFVKEQYALNKEEIRKKQKEYYDKNREMILEKKRQKKADKMLL